MGMQGIGTQLSGRQPLRPQLGTLFVAPSDIVRRPTGLRAATRNGHVVYVAPPLVTPYRQSLGKLPGAAPSPRPVVRTSLPTGGQATLLEQPDGRRVAHLLYYVWQRRAPDLDVIEDVVPLHGVQLAVRTRHSPKGVYLVPEGPWFGVFSNPRR